MGGSTHLSTWVSEDTKQRFVSVARYEGLSESALLRRMIGLMLQSASLAPTSSEAEQRVIRGGRLTVRLPLGDQRLLRERATSRSMPPATYAATLICAHLRSLTPLPKVELAALKCAVAELGAISRNLNQIARAANQRERASGPSREDLRAIVRACEGLRDHVKDLIKANADSWERDPCQGA
jgi:mobilization protein MobC